MKKYKDKDWLQKEYWERGRTQQDIARKCEVYNSTISRWVHRFGLQKYLTEEEAQTNPLNWNKEIAYLSGLITSDGSLCRDRRGQTDTLRIGFTSSDYSLILQVKEMAENNLNVNNRIIKSNHDVYRYRFTSRRFYYFLEDIGLMPNKSHKLEALNISDNMFLDWLRGEIDGDGCFGIYRSYLLLKIYSSSSSFLKWISEELKSRKLIKGEGNVNEYDVKGYQCTKSYQLAFADQDSKCIANAIYKNANYYLQRKYDIVKEFINVPESENISSR